MRRLLAMLSSAAALLVVPQLVAAGEPPKPGPFNPEVMFQRLDANRDGVITADEVPAGAPDRIKQFLIRADKNGDKKLTKEEYQAAVKDRGDVGRGPRAEQPQPPARGPEAGRRGGPRGPEAKGPPPAAKAEMAPGKPGFGPGPGMWGGRGPGGPPAMGKGPQRGPSGPAKGPGPGEFAGRGRGGPGMGPGPGMWGGRGPAPSPSAAPGKGPDMLKALFNRLDKDKDGKLNFAEFSAGMKGIHQRLGQVRDAAPGWAARGLSAPYAGWQTAQKAAVHRLAHHGKPCPGPDKCPLLKKGPGKSPAPPHAQAWGKGSGRPDAWKPQGKPQGRPDMRAPRARPDGKGDVKKPRGDRPDPTDAKIKELEGKIKALEAKIGGEGRGEGRKRRD